MSLGSIETVPYSRKHLDRFKPGPLDEGAAFQLRYEQGWDGKAVSAVSGDHVLGIFGVALVGDVAHAWLLLSDELRSHPVALSRWALRSLPDVLKATGAKEIQIETTSQPARRWARWLGFEGEREMTWRQPKAQY